MVNSLAVMVPLQADETMRPMIAGLFSSKKEELSVF